MSKQTITSPDCIRYHSGQSIGYFGESPTSMEAALADAVSGDIIAVFKSETITSNLLKNGVNWHFAPGVTVTKNNTSAGSIFSDAAGACSCVIGGYGSFVSNVTPFNASVSDWGGTLYLEKSGSTVRFEFDTISVYLAAQATNFFLNLAGIFGNGGNIFARGNRIIFENDYVQTPGPQTSAVFGLWWNSGEFNVEVNQLISGPRQAITQWNIGFYVDPTGSFTGDGRVRATVIDCRNGDGTAFQTATTLACPVWVTANEIFGYVAITGGKAYVTTQKLVGVFQCGSGLAYLRSNKIGGNLVAANGFAQNYVQVTGGKAFVSIDQFDATDGANVDNSVAVSGTGVLNLTCQDLTGIAGTDAVLVSGGTLNFIGGILTKATGKLSLKRTGGTLNVSPGVHYLAADTSGTISTLNLYGVVPGSTFKSTTIGT